MSAALFWWSFLLYSKNEKIYEQQLIINSYEPAEISQTTAQLHDKYDRQRKMIIGEGVFFGLALIAGISYLYVAYRRTLHFSERQNNFLLSITHELKSPLASIKLAFETIKKRNLSKEQNTLISTNGISEVNRLHNQLENILTATSLDHNYEGQLNETSLENLVNEIKNNRHYRPGEDRVFYSFDNDNTSTFKIDVYGCMLICENLIGNALKYSEKDVEVNLNINQSFLTIQVKDEGIGIPDHEKKNIFNRFYRVGNEDTRKSKGTGLGLYIANKITKKNQGTIEVLNNPKGGTIFKVEIKIK